MMLQSGRPSLMKGSSSRSHRRAGVRSPIVRAEPSTTTAPAADGQEKKIQSTISTLDAMLGVPPAPAQPEQQLPKPAAASSSTPAAAWPKLGPASTSSPAQRKPAAGVEAVMGFSGYAPEVINGRAAMLGFLAAISSELGNGESLFAQLVSGGAGKAAVVIAAVVIASFAPAIRQQPMDKVFGADKQPASWGPFTVDAERINGRAAMLGLMAMLLLEGASSQAFFM